MKAKPADLGETTSVRAKIEDSKGVPPRPFAPPAFFPRPSAKNPPYTAPSASSSQVNSPPPLRLKIFCHWPHDSRTQP